MTPSGALISDEDEASLDPVAEFTEWDSLISLSPKTLIWHLPCVEPVLGVAQEDGGSSLLSMDVQSLWNRERHEVSCLGPTWS